MKSYEDRVVLVTGASSGIGEAAAAAFQEAGAKVYGMARSKDTLDAARARHPAIHWVLADVTKPAEIDAVIENLVSEAGRLDVLVNNAAVFHFAPVEDSNDEHVRSHFETNVIGLVHVTRAALPALKASRGTILNISSAAGHKPSPGGAVYAATKAAVESLTKSWALELAPQGVRVNAVAPGPIETPGFDTSVPPEMVPVIKEMLVKQVPLGRMASPDELARWMVAISDPGVTWVTGAILAIDGGMSLT